MSKNEPRNEFQKAAEDALKKVGQDALAQVEDMVLNKEQKKGVVKAFNEVVGDVEKLAGGTVEHMEGKLKANLKHNVDKIGLGVEAKKQVMGAGEKVINGVADIAKEAIAQGADEARSFGKDCIKQACGAIKLTFSHIGSFISGEKTKDQALNGIKGAWMEAGKGMLQSAGKAFGSFVERMGGKKEHDKDKTHAEKVTENRDKPAAVDKVR
jgi:hypothetical protein